MSELSDQTDLKLNNEDSAVHDENAVFDMDEEVPLNPSSTDEESLKKFWIYITGLILAFTSGLIFTVNNVVIQTMSLDFTETLLIRSMIQIVFIGLILLFKQETLWPSIGLHPNRLKALILLQGLLGGLMIICAFISVLFLPLGDAMTLMFSTPISTMILAAIFLGHRLRLFKLTFGMVLLSGTILVVRPPFLFKAKDPDGDHDKLYFIGVVVALFASVAGGCVSIVLNFCQNVNSLVLLW